MTLVALREGYQGKISAEDLKAHLYKHVEAGAITDYAVPDYFNFVDELPKTSVGKNDKKILRETYLPA